MKAKIIVHEHHYEHHQAISQSPTKTAISATFHCLTGCAIGEILGMILTTAFGWNNTANIVVSVLLAFVFGYSLTMRPLARSMKLAQAFKIALAADTASIATMELADSTFILLVPGAINAELNAVLFWASLLASLGVAFTVALPVNRWLIMRGKGHAVVHEAHCH